MNAKDLAAAVLAVLAITGLSLPASAEVSGYTVAPAGPVDPRNSYVPPVNAVFVVDNAKGQISMCYPDSKDNKVVVVCTRRPSCRNKVQLGRPAAAAAVAEEAAYGLPPGIPAGVLSWITWAARSRISSS